MSTKITKEALIISCFNCKDALIRLETGSILSIDKQKRVKMEGIEIRVYGEESFDLKNDENWKHIDLKLRDIISKMNDLGFTTVACCYGFTYPGHKRDKDPYILFKSNFSLIKQLDTNLRKILGKIKFSYSGGVWELRTSLSDENPTEQIWNDLREALRMMK